MKQYEAVIWDLDGTLLDTLDDLTDSVNASLAQHAMMPHSRDEIRSFVGNGIRRLLMLSVPNGAENGQFESVYEYFKVYYAANCLNKTKPYDGIPELLSELHSKGYKNVVVSNKADFAVKELVEHFFPDSVDRAIGEKQGIRRKPCPDMVTEALRSIDVAAEKAVYIGDSDVDIETAKNAGMDCISVSWGFRRRNELLEAGAGVIADFPKDILILVHDKTCSM